MHGGRTIQAPRGHGPALGEASTLIHQNGSRVGVLAMTQCERAVQMAQLAHNVTKPEREACCSQTWPASSYGGPLWPSGP